jgi:hypothetical protein
MKLQTIELVGVFLKIHFLTVLTGELTLTANSFRGLLFCFITHDNSHELAFMSACIAPIFGTEVLAKECLAPSLKYDGNK